MSIGKDKMKNFPVPPKPFVSESPTMGDHINGDHINLKKEKKESRTKASK